MTTTGPAAVAARAARPPWRRWLLAVTPWAAAAALAVAGLAARGGGLPAAAGADDGSERPAALAASEAPTTVESRAVATMTAVAPDLPAPLRLAVLATARTALGTAGLAGTGPAPDRWPLEVVLTEVAPLGDGLAVAHVLGLVIEQTEGAWQPPVARAVAVPVRVTAPAAVLGDAWPLPSPVLPIDPPTGRDVDDPDPSIVAALTAAGWDIGEVTRVEAVLADHLRVTVRGIAPDDDTTASHTVWLRDDPGGPRPLAPTALQQEQP